MKPRLLILIAVAAILAIGLAFRASKPVEQEDIVNSFVPADHETLAQIREIQEPLKQRDPPPGEEPAEPPVFHVDVAVDRASGQNRLVFHITEEHGYYVESPEITFWYTDGTIEDPDDSPFERNEYFERVLKANDTLTLCIELVHPELDKVGGDIGASDNWQAIVSGFRDYRAENPDPPRLVGNSGACD